MLSRLRAQRLHLLLLALAALFAVYPLILHGCSCGHDFGFHINSWFDAATQFRHGELHPHWTFSAAWNAGEPRFIFYPPLSWYLGASIGLLLGHLPGIAETAAWNAAPIVFTWFALTLAGAAMYRLVRDYVVPGAALIAATAYMANPYMLFTAYERTAYSELLAAAWMPLLLLGILRPRLSIPRIAIPFALLWLTNAPAAVIGSYTLAFLAIARVAHAWWTEGTPGNTRPAGLTPGSSIRTHLFRLRAPINRALTIVAATAIALLTAAFYIVPAAYERRYVQIHMAEVPDMQIANNFLFHHSTGPDAVLHDQVLHTASMIAVLLFLLTIAMLAANYIVSRRRRIAGVTDAGARMLPAMLLASLATVIAFVLTPWSASLWRHAPEAEFLQFPWRAVLVLAVIGALALGGLLTRIGKGIRFAPAVSFLILAALVLTSYHVFRQGCGLADTPGAQVLTLAAYQGSAPTDEYTPVTADNDALIRGNPPYWTAAQPNAPPPEGSRPGTAPLALTLQLPRAEDLILNLRDYPSWTVLLDDAKDLQRLPRPDGLIAIPLPRGLSKIRVLYTRLPDQKIGDVLTLLGLGLLTASGLPLRWRVRRSVAAAPRTEPPTGSS